MNKLTITDVIELAIEIESVKKDIESFNERIDKCKSEKNQQNDGMEDFYIDLSDGSNNIDTLWNTVETKEDLEGKKRISELYLSKLKQKLKEAESIVDGWTKEEIEEQLESLKSQLSKYREELNEKGKIPFFKNGIQLDRDIFGDRDINVEKELVKKIFICGDYQNKLEKRLKNMQNKGKTPESKEETPPEVAETRKEETSENNPKESATIIDGTKRFKPQHNEGSLHNTPKGKNETVIDGTGPFKVSNHSGDAHNTSVKLEHDGSAPQIYRKDNKANVFQPVLNRRKTNPYYSRISGTAN